MVYCIYLESITSWNLHRWKSDFLKRGLPLKLLSALISQISLLFTFFRKIACWTNAEKLPRRNWKCLVLSPHTWESKNTSFLLFFLSIPSQKFLFPAKLYERVYFWLNGIAYWMPIQQKPTPPVLLFSNFAGWVFLFVWSWGTRFRYYL